jgi:anti-sigma regulatory factor (Ser/Thr protein kinase)
MGLGHRALLYDTDDAFVAEGLDRGEPVMVVAGEANEAQLRAALGPRADAVDFTAPAEYYSSPARTLAELARTVEAHAGGPRLRALGEIPLAGRGPEEAREWARFEALVNGLLADAGADVLCPYDTRTLSPEVLAHARCTHPGLTDGTADRPSADYAPPEAFLARLDADALPAPPADAPSVGFGDHPLPARRFLTGQARRAGMDARRLDDLRIAVGEIVNNAILHGRAPHALRAWVAGDRLVCEVEDAGPGISSPYAGFTLPDDRAPGGRGVWIARQLCHRVEVRGGKVRLHMRLG